MPNILLDQQEVIMGIKIKEVVSSLNAGIPIKDSWVSEQYGPYNIKNFNAPVNKILYCVTATNEVVNYFHKNGYDLLVSHHPFVKPNVPQLVYHTALDCCEHGLNDMWRDAIGLQNATHFDKNLGWVGDVEPIEFDDLLAKVEAFIGHKVIGHFETDGKPITSIVICTGLGGMVFRQAEDTGATCYLTGELSFPDKGKFNSIIEVGHTLTEFIGIRYLQKLLPDVQIDVAPLNLDYFGVETSIGRYSKRNKTFDFSFCKEEEKLAAEERLDPIDFEDDDYLTTYGYISNKLR